MISQITSAKSPVIKNYIAANKDKKSRYEFGVFVVDGIRMVRDAVRSNAEVDGIFIDKNEIEYIKEFENSHMNVYIVESYIISKLSSFVTPQGIVASVRFHLPALRAPIKNAVILDGIQDPGNAGAIMRTSLAVGITDIYFVNTVDPYNPKTIKSSMGSIFHLNLYTISNEGELLALLKQNNTKLICADISGKNIFKNPLKINRFALVIGNEGDGVSKTFSSAADYIVSLPMDKRVESLNAAASASVLLYTLMQS